jgi:hypothetical protein
MRFQRQCSTTTGDRLANLVYAGRYLGFGLILSGKGVRAGEKMPDADRTARFGDYPRMVGGDLTPPCRRVEGGAQTGPLSRWMWKSCLITGTGD